MSLSLSPKDCHATHIGRNVKSGMYVKLKLNLGLMLNKIRMKVITRSDQKYYQDHRSRHIRGLFNIHFINALKT